MPFAKPAYTQSYIETCGFHFDQYFLQEGIPTQQLGGITQDRQGFLWIASPLGLVRYDGHAFQLSPLSFTYKPLPGESLLETKAGQLFFSDLTGQLFCFDTTKERYTPISSPVEGRIDALQADQWHNLWLFSRREGLYRLQTGPSGEMTVFQNWRATGKKDTLSLPGTLLFDLVAGPSGQLWLISDLGLIQIHPTADTLVSFTLTPIDFGKGGPLTPRDLVKASVGPGGIIWVAVWQEESARQYLWKVDPLNGKIESFASGLTLEAPVSSILETSRGDLILGTLGKGIVVIEDWSESSGSYEIRQCDLSGQFPTGRFNVLQLFEDHAQNIWIRTGLHGLLRLNPHTNFFRYQPLPSHPEETAPYVLYVKEDPAGQIWAGTHNQGLFRFDPTSGSFFQYRKGAQAPYDMSSDQCFGLFWDRQNQFWIGAGDGLYQFFPSDRHFVPKGPPPFFSNIHEDKNGWFWIGTFRDGLYLADPEKQTWIHYLSDRTPGSLAGDQVFHILEDQQGNFWIATSGGLNLVRPGFQYDSLSFERAPAPWDSFYFTHEDSQGRIWSVYSGMGICEIDLTADTFRIHSLPEEAVIFVVFRVQQKRYQLRLQLEMEQREAERLKQLDGMKTRLYTNITHEFRTPLTIILGMAEKIGADPEKWFREGLEMIRRNGQSLLRLVNQMLELARLEAGALPPEWQNGNVIPYLHYLTESFHSLAKTKNIDLQFESDLEEFNMDFDAGKLRQICSNLLSNAVKFTPEGGKIQLSVGPLAVSPTQDGNSERLRIQVRDTGIGIPSEDLPLIFDRFYQAGPTVRQEKGGTGIGLALTRELVKVLGGEIRADSVPGEGTTMTVLLPVTRRSRRTSVPKEEESLAMSPREATPAPEAATKQHPALPNEQPTLLIVEDNPDVVKYLRSILEDHYTVMVGGNGEAGIQLALEEIPDLIISDVMMPEKDGFEVCETLKRDERTSHIPVILLTARADQSSRLAGLERGADAYLAKPFHSEELLVLLRKTRELRTTLQQRYQQFLPLHPSQDEALQIEDAFLLKVRKVIDEHQEEESFGVEELSAKLGLSRTQCFRKVKALTGQSPVAIIRAYKMQKARELLEKTHLPVTEIAYQLGFKDPAYFSRVFHQEFGESPTEYRE